MGVCLAVSRVISGIKVVDVVVFQSSMRETRLDFLTEVKPHIRKLNQA